jgi:transposase
MGSVVRQVKRLGRYSLDLRERVIHAYEQGNSSVRQVAARFQVDKNTVQSWIKRKRSTGSVVAAPAKGGRASQLTGQEQQLAAMVEAHPDHTLSEYCEEWQEKQGITLAESTMCRWLQKQQLTLRKNKTQPASANRERTTTTR